MCTRFFLFYFILHIIVFFVFFLLMCVFARVCVCVCVSIIAAGLNAGMDQKGGGTSAIAKLTDAVNDRLTNISNIAQAFKRLFRLVCICGCFLASFPTFSLSVCLCVCVCVLNIHVCMYATEYV